MPDITAARRKQRAQDESDQAKQAADKNNVAKAQIAHGIMQTLQLGHYVAYHSPKELIQHNAGTDVTKDALLKAGGVMASIPGKNGEQLNGTTGNGPALAAAYTNDASVLEGPDGSFRIPLIKYSAPDYEHNGVKYVAKDGSDPDHKAWNENSTAYLIDVPQSAWNNTISLTKQQVNDVLGYNAFDVSRGQGTNNVSLTLGNLHALYVKGMTNKNVSRQDNFPAFKTKEDYVNYVAQAQKTLTSPNSSPNDQNVAQSQLDYANRWRSVFGDISELLKEKPDTDKQRQRTLEQKLSDGSITARDRKELTAFQQDEKLQGIPSEIQAQVGKPPVPAQYPKGQDDPKFKDASAKWGQRVQQLISDAAGQKSAAEQTAKDKAGSVNFGTGIFGHQLGGPGVDRKEYNKRYDTFTKDYVSPLNRLKKTDMEFNRILNSPKMTGAEKVTALLSAVGISGEPLQGKGFRINQAVITEHAGARNIWESAVQRANQIIGTGGPITDQQVRDYESIARGVVHDAYVAAGQEAIRQGLNPDFLPKGQGKMPDHETATIYLDIAGSDRASAQKAMEANGWRFR